MNPILNPQHLNSIEAQKLYQFFESSAQIGCNLWLKDTPYQFTDGKYFCLTHDILKRQRAKDPNQVRYEVISSWCIGGGSQGRIYDITGTLALSKDHAKFTTKPRVVKVHKHHKWVESEYSLTKMAGHLAIKSPVTVGPISYTVMKKAPGLSLYQIMEEGLCYHLSIKERIDLSKMLLQALDNQVTSKGIIHRDIKPENIMVDLNDPMSVTILDFGLSIDAERFDGEFPGSPIYAPPETFRGQRPSFKADVFSMARIIALLFNVDIDTYKDNDLKKCEIAAHDAWNLRGLFKRIPDLSDDNKHLILSTLQLMLYPDVTHRLSIKDAIYRFDKINLNPLDDNTVEHNPLFQFDIDTQLATDPPSVQPANPWHPNLDNLILQNKKLKRHAQQLEKRGEHKVAAKMIALSRSLDSTLDTLNNPLINSEKKLSKVNQCHTSFENELMTKGKHSLSEQRRCHCLLINIALALAGLVIFYLAIAAATKKSRGSFLFFNQTKSTALVKESARELTLLAASA